MRRSMNMSRESAYNMRGIANRLVLKGRHMRKEKVRKYILRTWKQWRMTIFFIVFVIIPVKSSLADWNWVPTGSMNPTILEGDLIYVNKVAYDLRFPLTLHRVAREPQSVHSRRAYRCRAPDDRSRQQKCDARLREREAAPVFRFVRADWAASKQVRAERTGGRRRARRADRTAAVRTPTDHRSTRAGAGSGCG